MTAPLVLITGFGPFPGTERNPSREIASALELDPPEGLRVRARELPVSFSGAPATIAAFVEERKAEEPVLLLGLGVQPDAAFRLERLARGRLTGDRPDNDGRTASDIAVNAGQDLETTLDLEHLAGVLREIGAPDVAVSEDAGGYVCERTYHQLLASAKELGAAALFLHVPPADAMDPERQTIFVRGLLGALAASFAGR